MSHPGMSENALKLYKDWLSKQRNAVISSDSRATLSAHSVETQSKNPDENRDSENSHDQIKTK